MMTQQRANRQILVGERCSVISLARLGHIGFIWQNNRPSAASQGSRSGTQQAKRTEDGVWGARHIAPAHARGQSPDPTEDAWGCGRDIWQVGKGLIVSEVLYSTDAAVFVAEESRKASM